MCYLLKILNEKVILKLKKNYKKFIIKPKVVVLVMVLNNKK